MNADRRNKGKSIHINKSWNIYKIKTREKIYEKLNFITEGDKMLPNKILWKHKINLAPNAIRYVLVYLEM